MVETKTELKNEEKVEETKVVETPKKEVKKKNSTNKEAIVNAKNVPISTKQAIGIGDYIKNKNVDKAIKMLEEVLTFKKAVPMKRELPHRKGDIMSGRYPINATKQFIIILKGLKANALNLGIEIEDKVLACKSNVAPRPFRKFGRTRFKRTHVTVKLIKKIRNKK